MKISQKRICGDCWALHLNPLGCDFGYNIDSGVEGFTRLRPIAPTEPCPKPLTTRDYNISLTNSKYNKNRKD